MESHTAEAADVDAATVSTAKTVVQELALHPDARTAAPPRSRGYVMTAPLNAAGHLDTSGVSAHRWPVRRFGDPGDGDIGWLAHRGSAWFIDYDPDSESDNEPIFRLSDHRFIIGEYVTITSHEGEALTYRVVSVEPVA